MNIINILQPVFSYNITNPNDVRYGSVKDNTFKTIIVQTHKQSCNDILNNDIIIYKLTEFRYFILNLNN